MQVILAPTDSTVDPVNKEFVRASVSIELIRMEAELEFLIPCTTEVVVKGQTHRFIRLRFNRSKLMRLLRAFE